MEKRADDAGNLDADTDDTEIDDAVMAADDTGMIAQQHLITEEEIEAAEDLPPA